MPNRENISDSLAQQLLQSDRWLVANSDRLQLYTYGTPNGQKVSIALEEMGLAYETHIVNIMGGDQELLEYQAVNPNAKIPVLIDPRGPGHMPMALMESCAILLYLAEKSGKFLPDDVTQKSQCMQWLFFQAAHIGPMLGQFIHFALVAGDKCDHAYPTERYRAETVRLLSITDAQLGSAPYLLGREYSIADIAMMPWLHAIGQIAEMLGDKDLTVGRKTGDWIARCIERPATAAGLAVGKS